MQKNNIDAIKAVLAADKFEIHYLEIEVNTVSVVITNTKFRSTAQAVGRVISTLQRFTSDDIQFANISFATGYLQTGTYRIDLQRVTTEQYHPVLRGNINSSILAVDSDALEFTDNDEPLTWGVGPYFAQRLFNPDLPLSVEMGIEVLAGYQIANGLKISAAVRKSLLTNFTDNNRRSNSSLPRCTQIGPFTISQARAATFTH